MVDSADRHRLEDCKRELFALLKEERLAGASLLILANKQDLKGSLTAQEICQVLELESIATHHWAIEPVSAFIGMDEDGRLLNAMDWIVQDIGNRIFMFQ